MDMQILVVSSDPRDRELLAPVGRAHRGPPGSLAFLHAASLAEALRVVPRPVPDLILLNASGQRSRGGTLPAALALHYGATPVIMLCATSAAADRYHGPDKSIADPVVAHIALEFAPHRLLWEMFQCIVTAARRMQRATEGGGQRGAVLDAITDAVISTDSAGNVRYLNAAALRLVALTPREALGMPITEVMRLQDGATLAWISHPLLETLRTGEVRRLPRGSILLRNDGTQIVIDDSTSPIIDDAGAVIGGVMVFHDITDAHRLQEQVDYLAWHDFLTALPNRFAAQRHLERTLLEAQDKTLALAVMFLDLDRFKSVNDTLGHAAGDALLVAVAARLRGCFRAVDQVSRQGGDEFVVLMAPGTSRADATRAADRILAAIALPYELPEAEAHIGCSIGIAMYPEHGTTSRSLLHHADTALHAAKAAGRDAYRFFVPDMLASAMQRKQLEDGVRSGLAAADFELFYQPKIRLADGSLCGCEALLRWRHAQWGWVSPVEFIRSAEESGQIVALGRWVLAEAVRQAGAWLASGLDPGTIAINVSAIELRHPAFADHIERHIADARLDPATLQLELTESAVMEDMDKSAGILNRLKGLGLSLAIDDFGTGYSSLSYLADLPIDVLKIDRSFVHGIDHAQPRRQALLHAVIALAGSLRLPTVAEGVETGLEAGFLSLAGCAQGQGFYYGHALSADAFERTFLSQPAQA
ncbi:putative bifunctional diguanylate cyclase/phosphodiesterase [Pseudoduganella lutea]|uniref:EAL domain-containing protein n=1 Tax=Pseudoduganella lutea TaxID=321985 RepID=A0A4V0Z345_9BURK|nr:EAL domain-containing protein [Pseudoduganella lutea]QBE62163.1 EAL domain-containing protein [Pseudoduganella lutea]